MLSNVVVPALRVGLVPSAATWLPGSGRFTRGVRPRPSGGFTAEGVASRPRPTGVEGGEAAEAAPRAGIRAMTIAATITATGTTGRIAPRPRCPPRPGRGLDLMAPPQRRQGTAGAEITG